MDTNKPKRKRKIDVTIDTPNVDINITRDENGNTNVDIDTPRVDVHATKTDDEFKLDIDIDDAKEYTFEANGKGDHLPKGTLWKISGELLRIFLKQGLGKLHKK
jgi:hypothetical protein